MKSLKKYSIFCEKANKIVEAVEPDHLTTALAICSFCGQSVHYGGHENLERKR